MDPVVEEQLDYGDDDYTAGVGGGGGQKLHYHTGGAISALAEEELDDDYDDLYNDVNVGEGFMNAVQHHHQQNLPSPNPNPNPSHLLPLPNGLPESTHPAPPAAVGTEFRAPDPARPALNIPGVGIQEGKSLNAVGGSFGGGVTGFVSSGSNDYDGSKARASEIPLDPTAGNSGYRGSSVGRGVGVSEQGGKMAGGGVLPMPAPGGFNRSPGIIGSQPLQQAPQQQMQAQHMQQQQMQQPMGESNGSTMLFVGELQWWTTDAELESELSRYGKVKEIKFFEERASGKSKGYCQVEFFDAFAANNCKEGMTGHVFNGRPCIVVFATQQNLKQMGAAYATKTQTQAQSQTQGRRAGDNFSEGNRNFQGGNRMGWGRGGQGTQNRWQNGGNMQNRNRGNMGGNGSGNTGITSGAFGAPPMGGPPGALMQQGLMGPGFDPTYASHIGRGSMYGAFPAPAFPGMMPAFPLVNNAVGLPGVAPHLNPAFFGRGMAANGMASMGMMGGTGMDGHAAGMWTDPAVAGWAPEEHGRTRESSYGDDGASDYGYGESHDRGVRSGNGSREKERGGSERPGNSDRRHRDERDSDWDRHRYRDEKEVYSDQRQRERDYDNEEDWDRGRSSNSRSRSRSRMQEEDSRSRPRDVDYGKRKRLPSE